MQVKWSDSQCRNEEAGIIRCCIAQITLESERCEITWSAAGSLWYHFLCHAPNLLVELNISVWGETAALQGAAEGRRNGVSLTAENLGCVYSKCASAADSKHSNHTNPLEGFYSHRLTSLGSLCGDTVTCLFQVSCDQSAHLLWCAQAIPPQWGCQEGQDLQFQAVQCNKHWGSDFFSRKL